MRMPRRDNTPRHPLCIFLPTLWEVKETNRHVRTTTSLNCDGVVRFAQSSPVTGTMVRRGRSAIAPHSAMPRRSDAEWLDRLEAPLVRVPPVDAQARRLPVEPGEEGELLGVIGEPA